MVWKDQVLWPPPPPTHTHIHPHPHTPTPFGLTSVPMIFSTVADGLEFMIRQVGVSDVSHYFEKKKKNLGLQYGPADNPGVCSDLGHRYMQWG